ncbi:hypothetical protein SCLCIDRAFT_9365 [Scleroderma citrinum Foug A]|uniref:Uncharacterized protein n=1 Tax=Scleroderma citrinum Foug A TaxID=1036808 RepID=A0A0C3A9X7_9AGAM|nr:hypothetical protein SCLCIDRAFT_9365 [Scleroderma citrinum Foug A]
MPRTIQVAGPFDSTPPGWRSSIRRKDMMDVLSAIQPHLLSIPQVTLIYPVARRHPLRRPVLGNSGPDRPQARCNPFIRPAHDIDSDPINRTSKKLARWHVLACQWQARCSIRSTQLNSDGLEVSGIQLAMVVCRQYVISEPQEAPAKFLSRWQEEDAEGPQERCRPPRERGHRQCVISKPQEAPAKSPSHWQEEDAGGCKGDAGDRDYHEVIGDMSSQNPKRPLQNPSAVGKKRMRGRCCPDHHVNEVIGDKSSQNPKRPLPNPSAIGKKRMRGACKGDADHHASEVIDNKSSQNPKRPLQNPSAIGKKRMRGTRKGDADHANEVVGNMSSQNPKRPLPNPSAVGKKRMRGTREGDADHANEVVGNMSSQNPKRPLPNPSAVGKKRMRGTREGDADHHTNRVDRQYDISNPKRPLQISSAVGKKRMRGTHERDADHQTNEDIGNKSSQNYKSPLQNSSAIGEKRVQGPAMEMLPGPPREWGHRQYNISKPQDVSAKFLDCWQDEDAGACKRDSVQADVP